MVFSNNLLAGAGGQATGYEIDQSIRFNDEDSARLERTVLSSGSTTTWTTSVWVKRGKYTVNTNSQWFPVFSASDGSTTYDAPLWFDDVSTGGAFNVDIGGYSWRTNALARDTSAWYHVVTVWDSSDGTTADRMRLYINGERVTDFASSASPSSGANSRWNSSSYSYHRIGNLRYSSAETTFVFDGYLAEINFIDGTALNPTSFGETNSDTGQWVPVKYTGSYGTNGFYIDGATSTFLGKDAKATSAAVTNKASTSSEWGGSTGAYTFATNEIDRSSTVNAIISTDLLSGNFSFDFTMTTSGGALRVGVIDDQEFNTFNGTGDDGGMDSMTNSWYLDKGNNQFRYGGASQGSASGVANGSAVTIERTGSTIKITDDGSDAHTFSQTFSGPVRVVISGGGAAFNLDNVQYTADGASGNDNSFFSSGLAAADQMPDTPTNNFCTLNPVEPVWGAVPTISNGNLDMAGTAATVWNNAVATFKTLPSTGKWIWAAEPNTSGGGQCDPWIVNETGLASRNNYVYVDANGWETTFDSSSVHTVLNNGAGRNASFTYGSGDFHVVCFDADSKKLWFGVYDVSAGTLQFNDGSTGLTGDPGAGSDQTYTLTGNEFSIGFATYTGRGGNVDFGQSDLLSQITIPTGFQTLCTANLPDPTIALSSDHMNTVLYTGNGATGQSITGVGFQPDWVWTKIRSPNAYSHQLFDAVRGAGKNLQSNNTNAEGDISDEFKSFDSDGFTIDDVNQNVNESGSSYASWNWKANGSGSSNTDGSINTTATSANTTSGFSISTFTGNGTSGATFGHGLGVAPKMVIVKERSPAGNNWMVGHDAMGWGKYIALDTNAAQVTSSARWNDTAPSSTVVTLGNDTGINQNTATYVAYCFAEVAGYSSIGGYEGNGSTDGPFIFTGFKPAWIMLKRYDSSGEWEVSDRVRDPDNPVRLILQPNSNAVEWNATTRDIDWLSNGFKHRSSHADFNASGGDYFYLAFAESPFKTATAR